MWNTSCYCKKTRSSLAEEWESNKENIKIMIIRFNTVAQYKQISLDKNPLIHNDNFVAWGSNPELINKFINFSDAFIFQWSLILTYKDLFQHICFSCTNSKCIKWTPHWHRGWSFLLIKLFQIRSHRICWTIACFSEGRLTIEILITQVIRIRFGWWDVVTGVDA